MSEYPDIGLGGEGEASPICCQLFYSFLLPTVVACPEYATYAPLSQLMIFLPSLCQFRLRKSKEMSLR